jgi:hypothetical protein
MTAIGPTVKQQVGGRGTVLEPYRGNKTPGQYGCAARDLNPEPAD